MRRSALTAGLAPGLLFLFLASTPAVAVQASSSASGTVCLAVSDGGGVIRLLWPVPSAGWPAGGWRIQDESGREIKRVRAGDVPAPAGLSAAKSSLLKTLAGGPPSFASDKERETFRFLLLAELVSDPAFARTAGFSAVLGNVPAGRKFYRVVGLTLDGKTTGLSYPSPAVDASVPTPPPAAPEAPRAASVRQGVQLFWTKPAGGTAPDALTYFIERREGDGGFAAVSGKPLLLSASRDPQAPVFLDEKAPVDALAEYRIFGVDAFGRRSAPAEAAVFHLDHAALEPPDGLKATDGAGRAVLEWKPSAKPKPGQIMVWRALRPGGPYAALTPKGLPAGTTRYEDADVKAGVRYYYRVQVVDKEGREGPRSMVVTSAPRGAGALARPEGLKAEVERTRIRLSWKAPTGALLAGYLVERKDQNGQWARINERITTEMLFHDYGGAEGPAAWSYRVRAVALDNRESPPSEVVEVKIPDRSIPPSPEVVSANGAGGKAVVCFRPGRPEAKSAQFVVLRSGDPRDIGVVLGRPLPASARDYTDLFVEAGAEYWYRVVALGANGNRSEPSAAIEVRIAPPPIPAPPAPKAEFVAKPSPFVRVSFAPAPQGLEAVLERKLPAEQDWTILSVVAQGSEMVDANPPASGKAEYRIAYRTRSGVYGPASPAAAVGR